MKHSKILLMILSSIVLISAIQVVSGAFGAIEDLTTYTEYEENEGSIDQVMVVNASYVDWRTDLQYGAYLMKDYGVDGLGTFTLDFETMVTGNSGEGLNRQYSFYLADTLDDRTGINDDANSNATYFYIVKDNSGGDWNIGAGAFTLGNHTTSGRIEDNTILDVLLYARLIKNGTDIRWAIYNDASRTDLRFSFNVTIMADVSYQYLYPVSSLDLANYPNNWLLGYTQNVEFVTFEADQVVLLSPSDEATVKYNSITFSYQPTLVGNPYNASLWMDVGGVWQPVSVNETDIITGITNRIYYNIVNSGVYTWNVKLHTSSGETWAVANQTVTMALDYPTSYIIDRGTLETGYLNDTYRYTSGINFTQISEVTGAEGLVVRFNFTELVEPVTEAEWLMYGKYEGNPAHDVTIQVYNYTSDSWVSRIDINSSASWEWINTTLVESALDGGHMVSGGIMQVRLFHSSSGNPSHDIYFDFVALEAQTETNTISLHQPVNGTSHGFNTSVIFLAHPVVYSDNITRVELWTNETGVWAKSAENLTVSNDTDLTINYKFVYSGQMLWNMKLVTTGADVFHHENWTLTIGMQPTITLSSPAHNANATVNEDTTFQVTPTWYGSATVSKIEIWSNNTGTWENLTQVDTSISNATLKDLIYNFTTTQTVLWNARLYTNQSNVFAGANRTLHITALVVPTGQVTIIDVLFSNLNDGVFIFGGIEKTYYLELYVNSSLGTSDLNYTMFSLTTQNRDFWINGTYFDGNESVTMTAGEIYAEYVESSYADSGDIRHIQIGLRISPEIPPIPHLGAWVKSNGVVAVESSWTSFPNLCDILVLSDEDDDGGGSGVGAGGAEPTGAGAPSPTVAPVTEKVYVDGVAVNNYLIEFTAPNGILFSWIALPSFITQETKGGLQFLGTMGIMFSLIGAIAKRTVDKKRTEKRRNNAVYVT